MTEQKAQLMAICDEMLADPELTPEEKALVAKIRAQIEILL